MHNVKLTMYVLYMISNVKTKVVTQLLKPFWTMHQIYVCKDYCNTKYVYCMYVLDCVGIYLNYTFIHRYTYVCIQYMHIHTYIHTYMHTNISTCIHI